VRNPTRKQLFGVAIAGVVVALTLLVAIATRLPFRATFLRSANWFAGPMRPAEFGTLVKSAIDPESLRAWASSQLESVVVGQNPIVPVSQLPPELITLGARGCGIGPQANIGGSDDQRHVRVFWGFSFGNGYGILIGRTNLNLPTNRFCLRWVPGIYFIDPQHR
jgi:hypothetical protein